MSAWPTVVGNSSVVSIFDAFVGTGAADIAEGVDFRWAYVHTINGNIVQPGWIRGAASGRWL
jgi:hypothetical protein